MKKIEIPKIGMGSTQFWMNSHHDVKQTLYRFTQDYGNVCIDTAEMYGHGRCEKVVGDILQDVKRDDVFLIGKILPEHVNDRQFTKSLNQTLSRLQTDYLDCYLIHWRENANLHFLVQAMEEEVQKGRIRSWGVSNFDIHDMHDLLDIPGSENCVTNQVFYNLYTRGPEYDLFPLMQEHDIQAMSYSTLGSRYTNNGIVTKHPAILEICRKENVTPYALMLAFNMYHDVISLFSTSALQHMQENMKALEMDITPYLDTLNTLFPSPTHAVPLEKL